MGSTLGTLRRPGGRHRTVTTIFPNATCGTALIDRVIHHADVIAMEGESYRLREAAEAAQKVRKGRAGK